MRYYKADMIHLFTEDHYKRLESAEKQKKRMKKITHYCDAFYKPMNSEKFQFLMRIEGSSESRLRKSQKMYESYYTNEIRFSEIKKIIK